MKFEDKRLLKYYFLPKREKRAIPHLFERLFLISRENNRDCHITMTLSLKTMKVQINPLSPSGDQHQFSRNDIHTLSRDKAMRITEMTTKDKML